MEEKLKIKLPNKKFDIQISPGSEAPPRVAVSCPPLWQLARSKETMSDLFRAFGEEEVPAQLVVEFRSLARPQEEKKTLPS